MNKKGFTLTELLVVMVILSIITAISIPYYFTKYKDGFVVYHFLQIEDCKNYEEEILNSIQFQK